MRVIYVDNNATTKVAPEVVEEMLPYFSKLYGNASSMHHFGGQVAKKIKEAREKAAALLVADPSEIIYTSCGTESDSTAILSALKAFPEKKHIVTTRVEHPAIINLCKYLSNEGYKVTFIGVDREGMLDLQEVREAITNETAVVSIMYANNETGVIFPIEEIGQIVKAKGALFHCDAVQAAGKIPIDWSKSTIDMLSISGHKLHAPKGIGVLYIRKGTKFRPFLLGGHQEFGRRAGTENVPYIVGLSKACELAMHNINEENIRVKFLRDKLEETILNTIPKTILNGDKEHRLPNTLSISFELIEGEAILLKLSELGICASSGSACSSGSLEPSHVLRAMGIPFTAVHGSIRFSLSRYNTEEEIDYIIKHLPDVISNLRDISPFWKEEFQKEVSGVRDLV